MLVQHTQAAALDSGGSSPDAWAGFRVALPVERLQLLRELRDRAAPVILSAADGSTLGTTVWAVDAGAQRINFSVDPANLQLPGLVDADEVGAVAYLASVKLQFELHDFVLVPWSRKLRAAGSPARRDLPASSAAAASGARSRPPRALRGCDTRRCPRFNSRCACWT